jgi:Domain of unknown function (DUF397)
MVPNRLKVSDLRWRKARRSANNGACVELAPIVGAILVRDSQDEDGPIVPYANKSWRLFLQAAKRGQYDLERL